jgi:hypothetical protein
MRPVLKKLFTFCLALTLLVGAMVQVVPSGIAQATAAAQPDIAGGLADANAPCPVQAPTCVKHVGCLTISAVPTYPASPPTLFRWTAVAFEFAAPSLRGISVEPELSPPILAA